MNGLPGYKKSGYALNANPLIGIEKKCARCSVIKPCDEFYKRGDSGLYRSFCKKCYISSSTGYRKIYSKKWHSKNILQIVEKKKIYYQNNKTTRDASNAKWLRENPEKRKVIQKKMNAKRRANVMYRLGDRIGGYIWLTLKKGVKNGRRWESLVGFTIGKLKEHLEAKFTSGMNWENYGKWHVDHKRPIASFSFNTPEDEDFKRCWALENLQPLWARDNCSKGAKL